MCMADGADMYHYVHVSKPRARVEHRCDECYRTIRAGETYERTTAGYSAQRPDTWKTCSGCIWARSWIEAKCGSWVYGSGELMRDQHLCRALVGIRRKWVHRSGRPIAAGGAR